VFTYAKYGAAGQRLDQHVEFDQATRYERSHDCRCGGDKVRLSKADVGLSSRLIAGSVLGSSAIPVWARGTKQCFGRGVPIFPEEGRPGLFPHYVPRA